MCFSVFVCLSLSSCPPFKFPTCCLSLKHSSNTLPFRIHIYFISLSHSFCPPVFFISLFFLYFSLSFLSCSSFYLYFSLSSPLFLGNFFFFTFSLSFQCLSLYTKHQFPWAQKWWVCWTYVSVFYKMLQYWTARAGKGVSEEIWIMCTSNLKPISIWILNINLHTKHFRFPYT